MNGEDGVGKAQLIRLLAANYSAEVDEDSTTLWLMLLAPYSVEDCRRAVLSVVRRYGNESVRFFSVSWTRSRGRCAEKGTRRSVRRRNGDGFWRRYDAAERGGSRSCIRRRRLWCVRWEGGARCAGGRRRMWDGRRRNSARCGARSAAGRRCWSPARVRWPGWRAGDFVAWTAR